MNNLNSLPSMFITNVTIPIGEAEDRDHITFLQLI